MKSLHSFGIRAGQFVKSVSTLVKSAGTIVIRAGTIVKGLNTFVKSVGTFVISLRRNFFNPLGDIYNTGNRKKFLFILKYNYLEMLF